MALSPFPLFSISISEHIVHSNKVFGNFCYWLPNDKQIQAMRRSFSANIAVGTGIGIELPNSLCNSDGSRLRAKCKIMSKITRCFQW